MEPIVALYETSDTPPKEQSCLHISRLSRKNTRNGS